MLRGRSKMRLRRLMSGDRQEAHSVSKKGGDKNPHLTFKYSLAPEAHFGAEPPLMLRGRSKMRLRRLMSGDRQKAHFVSKRLWMKINI